MATCVQPFAGAGLPSHARVGACQARKPGSHPMTVPTSARVGAQTASLFSKKIHIYICVCTDKYRVELRAEHHCTAQHLPASPEIPQRPLGRTDGKVEIKTCTAGVLAKKPVLKTLPPCSVLGSAPVGRRVLKTAPHNQNTLKRRGTTKIRKVSA